MILYLSQREFNTFPYNRYTEYMEIIVKETGFIYRLESKRTDYITKNWKFDWHWVQKENLDSGSISQLLPLPIDTTKQYAWQPGIGWVEVTGGGTLWEADGANHIKPKNSKKVKVENIDGALQSGNNVSELVNDTGYITGADVPTNETDPVFSGSEAANFVAGDKANLDNQSGINTGDQVGDGVTITGTGTVGDPFVATVSGSGDVVGPAGATDGNVAVFDGPTGKKIKVGGTLGDVAFKNEANINHNALTNTHTIPPQSGDAADTIADAYTIPFWNTVASAWKKITWANFVSAISSTLSSIFAPVSHSHQDTAINITTAYSGNLSGCTTQQDANDVLDAMTGGGSLKPLKITTRNR